AKISPCVMIHDLALALSDGPAKRVSLLVSIGRMGLGNGTGQPLGAVGIISVADIAGARSNSDELPYPSRQRRSHMSEPAVGGYGQIIGALGQIGENGFL